MTMSHKSEDNEIIVLKILGIVTEPKCWAARYFADMAVNMAPNRYQMDMQFLFELEWLYLKRTKYFEIREEKPACAVWANDKFIGDDIGLCKFLKNDNYISANIIHTALNVSVQISRDSLDYCPRDLNRSYVFFNIEINKQDKGRILMEIYNDLMPISSNRFLKECIRYDGCPVHRITHNGWFESGRFEHEDKPIREKRPTGLSNCREGMLSLVNSGRSNCKSSQFLITLVPAKHLDPYQCPIGSVLEGIDVLKAVDKVKTHFDSPLHPINITNVTVLYCPQHVCQELNLSCEKVVDKPAYAWTLERKIRRNVGDEEVLKYRIDLKPNFQPVATIVDDRVNEVRKQLNEENNKLKQIIDETRFAKLLATFLREKKLNTKSYTKLDERDRKWYQLLLNADSEFEMFYRLPGIPQVCDPVANEWFNRAKTIENPAILRLIQYVHKRELNHVLDIIRRLMEQSIEIVIHRPNELYVPNVRASYDHQHPFDDDLERLPKSMQDVMNEEACKLSKHAFELLHNTLRQMIENVSDSKLADTSTMSGDLLRILQLTDSMLGVRSLSEEEIEKRKESIMEDIDLLTKSMVSIHERTRSEPLPIRIRHPAYLKSESKRTF